MKLKKIKKIEIEKTERLFKKTLLFIAKHVFEFSLLALFLSFIIGVLVFYKYSILAQKVDPGDLPDSCLLEEKPYQKTLDIWTENEKIFHQADYKNYHNMFLIIKID